MSTDYWQYRPAKRPSVKQVDTWQEIYADYAPQGSRFAGEVRVYRGYPFPDFYKVTLRSLDEGKHGRPKYFYGETAHHQVESFVYDMGFGAIRGRV